MNLILIGQSATNVVLAAADAGQRLQGDVPWYKHGVMEYLIDGGIFMWPILVLGVIALAVVIERYRSLKMLTVDNQGLRDKVLELLHAQKGEEALQLCNESRGPVPAILAVGLRKFLTLKRLNYDAGKIQEQVAKAMDDYGVHIVAALENHLPMLATISSVAPMLGSVGTVVGMVVLFNDLAMMSSSDPIVQIAAAGIKIKLLVTVWGLLVGIPAYVAFNYFTNVIDRYVLQVEETATELFEAVTLRIALERQQTALAANGTPELTSFQTATSGGPAK
jgi:biopolymer transport protein ExbB